MMNNETKMALAQEIIVQLGGNKFTVMTGAKQFMAIDNGLAFKLPGTSGYTKQSINYVEVILNGKDLYDVTYSRFTNGRKQGPKKVVKHVDNDIYFDMLQDSFTEATGLYTSL